MIITLGMMFLSDLSLEMLEISHRFAMLIMMMAVMCVHPKPAPSTGMQTAGNKDDSDKKVKFVDHDEVQ